MKHIRCINHFRHFRNLAIIGMLLFVSASCAHTIENLSQEELQDSYMQAVQDAEIAEPHEISKELIAIVPANDYLYWNQDKSAVLVTTWTASQDFSSYEGKTIQVPKAIWVTVIPEMHTFFTKHPVKSEDLSLRLEQLLGLPPQSGYTHFVEMWVSPEDLFRPSADPEISDSEAEIESPVSSLFIRITDWYTQWFSHAQQTSYGDNGYPWTRLGYTYDWGNPKSEIGLSEFVICPEASVVIHRIVKTRDYFE